MHVDKNWVFQIREAAGLSLKDLSDRTGISIASLHAYEAGDFDLKRIPAGKVEILAAGLGVSVDWLLYQRVKK